MLASENSVCEGLSVTKKGEGEKREGGTWKTAKKKIKNKKKGTGQLEKEERRRRK